MPDERISMFPYTLSTELLSLGAGLDSYALSCGVTLDELGVCVCVCASEYSVDYGMVLSEAIGTYACEKMI